MVAKTADKRAVFIREYLVDRNGTRAAIAAGYAPRSASVTSCHLLRNAKVRAEVSELTERRLERLEVTADAVLQELAKIAFANMTDYLAVRDDGSISIDVSRIGPIQAAALADLRIDEYASEQGHVRHTRLKLASKTKALELLGKHLKLWTDRLDAAQSITIGETLQRARERMLRGMSDEELQAKIKELQSQLECRYPKIDIRFVAPECAE